MQNHCNGHLNWNCIAGYICSHLKDTYTFTKKITQSPVLHLLCACLTLRNCHKSSMWDVLYHLFIIFLSFRNQGEATFLYNKNKNCPLCSHSEKLVCHKIRIFF